ncbi:MAG: hypothetical protein H6711_25235 [Myxococcales bacterium]|nr:hypothetical protein [Myxococcales bacterium]
MFLGINAGDGFEVESLDDDAEVDAFSKPAMSATAEATCVLWNSAGAGLVLLRLSWAG